MCSFEFSSQSTIIPKNLACTMYVSLFNILLVYSFEGVVFFLENKINFVLDMIRVSLFALNQSVTSSNSLFTTFIKSSKDALEA